MSSGPNSLNSRRSVPYLVILFHRHGITTWRFPNELPIAGEPADVYSTIEQAHMALSRSSYPKLLLVGDPGTLFSPAFADRFAKKLSNCRVIHVGPGRHYLQEDHPEEIGKAIAE